MRSLTSLADALCRGIDRFTEVTGRLVAWLAVLLVALTATVVFMRYFLNSGSIALQESLVYIHATLFMLAIPFTLRQGGHVRVDVVYRRFSPRTRAWVDIAGTLLLLLPVAVVMFFYCREYVASSWAIRESSGESTGLPWVYLLKTLLLIMPVTLALQGIAELLRNALFLAGVYGPPAADKLESL